MQDKRLENLERKLNVTETRWTMTMYGIAIKAPGDPDQGYNHKSASGEPLKVVRVRHSIFPTHRQGETLRLRGFFTDSGEDPQEEDRDADYIGPYKDFENWLKEQHEKLDCELRAIGPNLDLITIGGELPWP